MYFALQHAYRQCKISDERSSIVNGKLPHENDYIGKGLSEKLSPYTDKIVKYFSINSIVKSLTIWYYIVDGTKRGEV